MRRGRRKGTNRDKVFGCDLQEHLNSTAQEIPQVLRRCSEFIEEYGIVDGIYRLSGVSSNTQKLRSEFDTEGTPELYKEVYLQDIHCVSSLCKAYFRELPNPLLTYELYDRFADAVAVQLEDERLVKIKEVLKDLPVPHYRTLEYLMHHLVKMSTHSSQTNMHSRNLAIVWAPNLLRSKDIESTGFNGTAAFMEVRVQSIVVEFILTHVPELFSAPGLAVERRKSLPSPTILAGQDEHFFKSLPLHLSPGDGPPPMRPYHSIIDGTDKRKGSLKGRKWKSIFNLGGRLHDPRKKSKYCLKDKEKTSLRPAKSMDSLSSGPFAQEDPKHPPALVLSPANPEGVASVGGGVSSGYAVTYRRTGGAQVSMVSGGSPGTYNRRDSASGMEGAAQGMSRSPGMSSKAERRAGIHISGPFSVTVPLHITSGLALGVLQGGWNDKEQRVQGEAEEHTETEEDEDEDLKNSEPDDDDDGVKESKQGDCEMMTTQIIKEEDVLEEEDSLGTEETVKEDLIQDQETIEKSLATKEDLPPQNKEETLEEEYMDMRGHHQAQVMSADQREMDEFSEQDVQDAFGFLDMMDSSASNQPEFSVEAPEEVAEEDEDESTKTSVRQVQNLRDESEETEVNMSTPPFTSCRSFAGKSHSLPYKSRPFMPAQSLSSDDEYSPEDEDDDDVSDKDFQYEDMFCKSLPSSLAFHGLSWSAAGTSASSPEDGPSDNQSECLDEIDVILPDEDSEVLQSISQSQCLDETDVILPPMDSKDLQSTSQSECLDETDVILPPIDSKDLQSTSQSECLDETDVILPAEDSKDLQSTSQSECLDETDVILPPMDSKDLQSTSQSECLDETDVILPPIDSKDLQSTSQSECLDETDVILPAEDSKDLQSTSQSECLDETDVILPPIDSKDLQSTSQSQCTDETDVILPPIDSKDLQSTSQSECIDETDVLLPAEDSKDLQSTSQSQCIDETDVILPAEDSKDLQSTSQSQCIDETDVILPAEDSKDLQSTSQSECLDETDVILPPIDSKDLQSTSQSQCTDETDVILPPIDSKDLQSTSQSECIDETDVLLPAEDSKDLQSTSQSQCIDETDVILPAEDSKDLQSTSQSQCTDETDVILPPMDSKDLQSTSQSQCTDETDVILPAEDSEDQTSISQSEPMILTAATDDHETWTDTFVQIYNKTHTSGYLTMDDLHVNDDEKNEENKSEDVTNNKKATMVEDSSGSDEDTYFGPDPIPCSMELIQTETASTNVHEPIHELCVCVEAPLDTEIYTAIEILISDVNESMDVEDEVNINPSPEEENTTVHEGSISEDEEKTKQAEGTEKSEEYLKDEDNILEEKTTELSEYEEHLEEEDDSMEECVKNLKEMTKDKEERVEEKEHKACDMDKENNEDPEKHTDSDEGNISCEDERSTFTQTNEVSGGQTDEEAAQTAEDHPVPEEEKETPAPKQTKAVPVVPPKPQRSKLTALTLRKQFDNERQQRHSQFIDTGEMTEQQQCVKPDISKPEETSRDVTIHRDESGETSENSVSDTSGAEVGQDDRTRAPVSEDIGMDFRRDLHRDGEREMKRNSGISMCFDEAVARATVKRSKETSERLSGAQWEKDSRREGFKHKEKDDENKTD